MIPTVPQILTKNKTSSLNHNRACANYGIYVTTCMICNQQYVGQSIKNFPRDGQRIEVLGTKQVIGMTTINTALSRPDNAIFNVPWQQRNHLSMNLALLFM